MSHERGPPPPTSHHPIPPPREGPECLLLRRAAHCLRADAAEFAQGCFGGEAAAYEIGRQDCASAALPDETVDGDALPRDPLCVDEVDRRVELRGGGRGQ